MDKLKGRQESIYQSRYLLMLLHDNELQVAGPGGSKAGSAGREHSRSKIFRYDIII